MLLRIVRGTVLPGREDDFVAISRRQAQAGDRAPGLLAFMAGYQRVERTDRYILATTWLDDASLAAAAGDDAIGQAPAPDAPAGVATIDSIDHYQLVEPLRAGILDEPGSLLRVTSATVRPGKLGELLSWVRRKEREIGQTRSVLGWSIGLRTTDGREEMFGVAAWASPLQLESMAEEGRSGKTLFAVLDSWLTDVRVEHYQAIELRVAEPGADVVALRLIAARFASEGPAEQAKIELESTVPSAREAGVYVARLGGSGLDQFLLVARTSLAEHGRAERAIVDAGGQVVYETNESASPAPTPPPTLAEQPVPRPIT